MLDTSKGHAYLTAVHLEEAGNLREISWPLLLWSGLTALVISSFALMLLRRMGATRYLPRAYWSCAIFGTASDAALMAGGLLRMVSMIALFPVAYAAVFAYAGDAVALTGLAAGAAHGVLAGLALPLVARRCSGAHPPGLFGVRLGRATPLVLLFIHTLYGTTLGYIYVIASP